MLSCSNILAVRIRDGDALYPYLVESSVGVKILRRGTWRCHRSARP
jgi:hypothetical protein